MTKNMPFIKVWPTLEKVLYFYKTYSDMSSNESVVSPSVV